jgi:hypothetical protein
MVPHDELSSILLPADQHISLLSDEAVEGDMATQALFGVERHGDGPCSPRRRA